MIMAKYLVTFIFYSFAMIGIVLIAFLAFKNLSYTKGNKKKSSISVEESLSLSPRKTLYIINIRGERFLIAGDADKTTFLAKLNNNEKLEEINLNIKEDENVEIVSEKPKQEINTKNNGNSSMRKLLSKLATDEEYIGE